MSDFNRAFEYAVGNEGGFSNHPADRGGATKFGITQHTLSTWRGQQVSVDDVRNLFLDEARAIYKKWYWDTLHLDSVHSPLIAICMFDLGIVRGISIPPRYAQSVCNSHNRAGLVEDGKIGPKTIAALNSIDGGVFVTQFARKAKEGFEAIVRGNPSQAVFLKGWTNRANRYLTLLDHK